MTRPATLALILTLLLAAAMAAATLMPLPPGPGLPGSDKTHHILGFAVLALPMATVRPRAMLWLAPLLACYGGVIEIVQPFVGRGREWADWLADLAGIGLGTLAGLAFWRVLRLRETPPRA
jgi:VanZ family protein